MIALYAHAQASLARIEERQQLSPVRQPWRVRRFIAERQALAQIDGLPLHDADFHMHGRGSVTTSSFDLTYGQHALRHRITLDRLVNDSQALLSWLGLVDSAPMSDKRHWHSYRDLGDILTSMDTWRRDILALPPSPPLIHSAHIAWLWHRHAPIGRGDWVAALLLGDRWGPGRSGGSMGGLVALGLNNSMQPWKTTDRTELVDIWLGAIATAADLHLDMELRLRAYAVRAKDAIDKRRRPGRLRDVLSIAMVYPRITSADIARKLGLTSAGAIKLLTIATEANLLIEQTGQSSYRHYAIPVAGAVARSNWSSSSAAPFERSEFWVTHGNDVPPEAH